MFARYYALSTPLSGQAEHSRVDPAHSQTASKAISPDVRRDYCLTGSGRAGVESRTDPVCVGWQVGLAARPESAAATSAGRVWGLCHTSAALPSYSDAPMATKMSNDPLELSHESFEEESGERHSRENEKSKGWGRISGCPPAQT
jgi:hypothetical protein